MIEVWNAAKSSTYRCMSISGRAVYGKRKRKESTDETIAQETHWRRDELRRSCERLWHPRPEFPRFLRKHEYAAALVMMLGFRRLEHVLTMWLIKSDACSICKDKLKSPVFRCEESGYHLICIRNYMLVSHNFKDPILNREFTDDELIRCDKLSDRHAYHKEDGRYKKVEYDRHNTSLYLLKNDPERVRADREQHIRETEIDLISESIVSEIENMQFCVDDDLSNSADKLEQYFRFLSQLSEDSAKQQIHDFITARDIEINEPMINILRSIEDKISIWAQEDDDDDNQTFIPIPTPFQMFGRTMIPIVSPPFLPHPQAMQSLMLQLLQTHPEIVLETASASSGDEGYQLQIHF